MFDQIWVDLFLKTQQNRLVRDTFAIPRDYGKVIIISQSSLNSCLHVLDGTRFDQAITEARTDVRYIAKYSDLNLIDPSASPALPPADVFGMEPSHGWCYYYQKMDLARQVKDWQTVVALAQEAKSLELEPAIVSEWLPALEAYVQLNKIDQAKKISLLIREDKFTFTKMCSNYESLAGQAAGYERDSTYEALCKK